MSPNDRSSGSGDGVWPPGIGDAGPITANLSLVVGRGLGTVVVTVDGELDLPGCERLRGVLTDLIEGQGNRAVAVDLTNAVVEPNALDVFIDAARQSRRQGTKFILKEPPTDTHDALHSAGFGDLIRIADLREERSERGAHQGEPSRLRSLGAPERGPAA